MSGVNDPEGQGYACASIALVLICIVLIFAPPAINGALTYDRQAILAGQVWRLWTGHLTHFSLQHMLVDTGVLMLVILLAQREAGAVFTSAVLLCGMPLIALGLLLLVPGLTEYRGASGIDILLAVALGVRVWFSDDHSGGHRFSLLLLCLCLLIKIGLEAWGIGSSLSHLPKGIRVVWEAHALGAVIGAVIGTIIVFFWKVPVRCTRSA